MDLREIQKTFFNQKLDGFSKVLYLLVLINGLLGLTYILVNHFGANFTGDLYFAPSWAHALIPLILLNIAVIYFKDMVSPRVSLTIFTFSMYALGLDVGMILTQGIQYTPFPTIDHWLLHMDQLMHINSGAILNWVYQRPHLGNSFIYAYNGIEPELVLLPILMALLLCKRSVKVFLFAMLLSYPIGTLIYYFFPTTAPASIIHNAHFLAQQHDTGIKFYEIHHYLKLTTSMGGMIAFPSFHVICATLLIYVTKEKKYIFIPVLIYNIWMIASTVMLGWHYMTDVIGGLIIALGCLYLGERLYKKCYLTTLK